VDAHESPFAVVIDGESGPEPHQEADVIQQMVLDDSMVFEVDGAAEPEKARVESMKENEITEVVVEDSRVLYMVHDGKSSELT
jgi:hypothetical protein